MAKTRYLVKDGRMLQQTVAEAFHVARSGRPGPVLIDLPKDILMGEYGYKTLGAAVPVKSVTPRNQTGCGGN